MVQKEMDFSKIKEAGVIRSQIKHVYNRGRLNIINVIGQPGGGKSWACLRLAELVSQDLHGKNTISIKNVVTDLLSLLKFIRNVKGPGEIVICEEVGVWLSSRRAMAAENVDSGAVFDTLRKKRIIVFTNNPISSHVDKRLITLSSMKIEAVRINKTLGVCILKPHRLQTNVSSGKTYSHTLRNTKGRDVNLCWSGKPSEELTNAYEDSKDTYLDELYERLQNKHEDKKEKEINQIATSIKLPTKVEIERAGLYDKGLTLKQISEMKGVDIAAISRSIKNYKTKMQNIQNVKSV